MAEATAAVDKPTVEAGATKQERVDLLKQMVAFAEGNVRSYDTKAQISLAAFVLSANPLVAVINSACGTNVRNVLMILVVVYLATILTYMWVLWPVAPPQQKLTEGLGAKNLFYIHDPLTTGGPHFAERLKELVLEPELTAEALKLAHIRKVKAQRFKNALITTLIAYLVIAAGYFAVGRCAF
jgi:hypothetical protein